MLDAEVDRIRRGLEETLHVAMRRLKDEYGYYPDDLPSLVNEGRLWRQQKRHEMSEQVLFETSEGEVVQLAAFNVMLDGEIV